MEQIKKYSRTGFEIVAMVAALAWAGALIYAIFTDPGHAVRYGLKLVVIVGLVVWYVDSKDVQKSEPE